MKISNQQLGAWSKAVVGRGIFTPFGGDLGTFLCHCDPGDRCVEDRVPGVISYVYVEGELNVCWHCSSKSYLCHMGGREDIGAWLCQGSLQRLHTQKQRLRI